MPEAQPKVPLVGRVLTAHHRSGAVVEVFHHFAFGRLHAPIVPVVLSLFDLQHLILATYFITFALEFLLTVFALSFTVL